VDIEFFFKIAISSASLTDHSRKARDQTKQAAIFLQHKTKLTWDVLLVPTSALSLLSSIRLFFSMQ